MRCTYARAHGRIATVTTWPEPPHTAQPMSICATTQRGSVRSITISQPLLSSPLSMNRCVAPNSAAWLWKYAGPRPSLDGALAELVELTARCCSVAW